MNGIDPISLKHEIQNITSIPVHHGHYQPVHSGVSEVKKNIFLGDFHHLEEKSSRSFGELASMACISVPEDFC